jgi:type II secretory pathway predicted ATPase ExeA
MIENTKSLYVDRIGEVKEQLRLLTELNSTYSSKIESLGKEILNFKNRDNQLQMEQLKELKRLHELTAQNDLLIKKLQATVQTLENRYMIDRFTTQFQILILQIVVLSLVFRFNSI